jgi:hypothetical protein
MGCRSAPGRSVRLQNGIRLPRRYARGIGDARPTRSACRLPRSREGRVASLRDRPTADPSPDQRQPDRAGCGKRRGVRTEWRPPGWCACDAGGRSRLSREGSVRESSGGLEHPVTASASTKSVGLSAFLGRADRPHQASGTYEVGRPRRRAGGRPRHLHPIWRRAVLTRRKVSPTFRCNVPAVDVAISRDVNLSRRGSTLLERYSTGQRGRTAHGAG